MQSSPFPDSMDPLRRVTHLGPVHRTVHAEVGLGRIEPPPGKPPFDGPGSDEPGPDDSRVPAALLRRVTPKHAWYLPFKTVIEWVIALGLFIALSPLMLMLAALVRFTSRGPAFYAQSRLGLNGKRYRIYKLRTMAHDCEKATGPVWAAKDDLRITPVGKILRNTHLDEVPQLWNVLRGDMALIGPRPERPEIAARVYDEMPEFELRLRLRPGITGLAQMLLPADDPDDTALRGLRHKLAHDLLYIRDVSPLVDLRIALSTSCYFTSAAIDAMRQALVRPCGTAARGSPLTDDLAALRLVSDHA